MQTTTHFITTNNLTIHIERTGGEKQPFILCHGIADNGRCMLRLAEHLAPNYDVILADARGHGQSEAPASGYSADHHADDVAGIIIVAPTSLDAVDPDTLQTSERKATGLLESVVTSMLQQAGGKLDSQSTPNGIPVYRVLLPHATAEDLDDQGEDLPIGLEAYIAGWQVLVCQEANASPQLQRYLKSATVTVENAASIVDALSRIESGTDLAAILINREMLGEESEGLLRAIIKLCPQAGLVVQDAQEATEQHHTSDLVVVPTDAPPAQVLRAMIEARSLARARHRPA